MTSSNDELSIVPPPPPPPAEPTPAPSAEAASAAPRLTKVFVCALCPSPDFIFQSTTDLHRHATQMHHDMQPKHREEERDLSALTCSVCRKPWSSIRKLSGHASRMHAARAQKPQPAAAAAAPPAQANAAPVSPETRIRRPTVLSRQLALATASVAPTSPPKRPHPQVTELLHRLQSSGAVSAPEPKKRLRLDEMAPFYTDDIDATEALAEMTKTSADEWSFLKDNGIVYVGILRTLPKSFVVTLAKRFLGSNQYKISALCSLAEVQVEW